MKVRLMGPAVEVADVLEVLRRCQRLELATVSDLLPTRGGNRGARWVRAYIDAAVKAQTEPCHASSEAVWVGETAGLDGPVHLWSCRGCGGTWTTTTKHLEVTR